MRAAPARVTRPTVVGLDHRARPTSGVRRFYAEDPFGNRFELVDREDRDFSLR